MALLSAAAASGLAAPAVRIAPTSSRTDGSPRSMFGFRGTSRPVRQPSTNCVPVTRQQQQRRSPSLAVRAAAPKAGARETVVVEPDPRIPIVLLGMSGALFAADNKLAAAPIGLLGALLAFQTTRVRFVFGPDALEVRIGQQLDSSGENVFVGGENKWKYDTFVNWEFWWPGFPVLVYFKETQTRPEGQVHFFPIIAIGKQLYDVMVERCGPSKGSGPSA